MAEIIHVKVIPRAKKNEVKKKGSEFKVYLTAAPVKGKANKILTEVLAEYFGCRKSGLRIIKGEKSKDKLIQKLTEK